MAVVALVGGLGLADLVDPAPGFGVDPVAAADPRPAPATDIGDAVAATRTGTLSPAPVEELVVVQVSVNVCGDRSSGSGVVIADGLLLTAAHVVGDAALVRVDHGGVAVTGEVLGVLADGRDLALVAVDAPRERRLVPVPPPAPGEPITMVGYPAGGPRTVVVGARVALADAVAAVVAPGAVGVDAHTGLGFSGGPALDENGALVGIVVATEQATGTALVIPLHDLGRLDETTVVEGRCPTDA